jgi:chromosome segregation ATPase
MPSDQPFEELLARLRRVQSRRWDYELCQLSSADVKLIVARIDSLTQDIDKSKQAFTDLREADQGSLTEALAAALEQMQRADRAESEITTLRQELTQQTNLTEGMRSERNIMQDQLIQANAERDALKEEHDTISTLLRNCGYGTIDEMLPKFRESCVLQKVIAEREAERDALAKALRAWLSRVDQIESTQFLEQYQATEDALNALTKQSGGDHDRAN